jgi:hypothetical protein
MQLPAFGWALLLGGVYWTRRMCGRVAAAGIGARGLAFAVIALLLGGYALAFAAWVRSAPTLNLGYHSASWRRSEALARIRQDYPHTPIFTYDAPAIYFQLGRTDFVQAPPRTLDAAGQRPNPDFERQMTLLLGDLAARHGVFVYFKRNAPNLPPLAELEADPNLRPAGETKDAVFFLPVSKPN